MSFCTVNRKKNTYFAMIDNLNLYSVRNTSLGRGDYELLLLHPVRDASLAGCSEVLLHINSTERSILNRMQKT
jgi:hypothetical protein